MPRMEITATVALPDNALAAARGPDGALLLATLDGALTAVDGDGRVRWQTRAHPGGALALDVSPDGALALTTGQDGDAATWSVVDGAPGWRRALGDRWCHAARWSRDGALAALSAGRDARFVSRAGEPVGPAVSHASTVTALEEHRSLGWMSACYGGVQVLAPGRDRPTRRMPFRGSIVALALSPDGRYIAGGSQDATVRLWDLTHRQETSLTGYPGKVTALAWSDAGTWLATHGGASVVLWRCDVPTVMGTVPLRLTAGEGRVRAVCFSGDGQTLLAAGDDGLARWRLDGDEGPELAGTLRTGTPLRGLWRADDDAMWCADVSGRAHRVTLA